MTLRVDFHFRDQSGSNGQFRLYLPSSLSISAITTAVTSMSSAVQAISGASLTHVVLRLIIAGDYAEDIQTSASADSNLFVAFCDDEGNRELVLVPFISVSLMELNGCGAFLRLDEQFPEIPNAIALMQQNFCDAFGNPLGEEYNAGILIRGQGAYTLPIR